MSKVHGARFAQIPEWVLDAAISDRAVRAYCVLARYANSDSRAHPGRRKMADRMDCSTDSLDRALKELVSIGALEIRPRFRENGDRTSNDYHLLDQPQHSGGVGAQVRLPPSAPPRPAVGTGAVGEEREPENDTQVEELPPRTAVEIVFDAWKASTKKTAATRLDPKRTRLIIAALKDYPLEDVLDAVRGWEHSPHHRGENSEGKQWNDLGLLLRDAGKIEQFRDLARAPRLTGKPGGPARGHLPVGPSRLSPQDNAAMRAQDDDPNFDPDDF